MSKDYRITPRPAPAGGKLPQGKDACIYCGKRLDITGQSIAALANGASCPACAKAYRWKGLILPPRQ